MSARNKELKEKYKDIKPEMGIVIIKNKQNNKCLLVSSLNIKGTINGSIVKLKNNMYPNRELQKEWNEMGEDRFLIEIIDKLEYDINKTDYKDDLDTLLAIWEEKLSKESGIEFYKR